MSGVVRPRRKASWCVVPPTSASTGCQHTSRWLLLGIQGSFRRRKPGKQACTHARDDHQHTAMATAPFLRPVELGDDAIRSERDQNGRGMQSAPLAICKQRRSVSQPAQCNALEACRHRQAREKRWGRGRHVCHAAPGATIMFLLESAWTPAPTRRITVCIHEPSMVVLKPVHLAAALASSTLGMIVLFSFQKQTSYTFRGYVLLGERDVTKFQGCTRLAV